MAVPFYQFSQLVPRPPDARTPSNHADSPGPSSPSAECPVNPRSDDVCSQFVSDRSDSAPFPSPPFFAAMLEASSEALDQSSFPDPCNLSGNTRWIRSHSPSPFHRCNRRQHVIPLPQPILRGGCSCQLTRGDPLWNRYRVPFLPEGMRHSPVPRQAPEECPFR